jgi:type I restriction enzyme S subunit
MMTKQESKIPSLRFSEFDGEWEEKSVETLIDSIGSGWSPDCEVITADSDEWGVLKTTAVKWRGFNPSENKKLPAKLQPRVGLEVLAGDILITRAGPSERVGVIAYVKECRPKLMISDKIIRLRCGSASSSAFLARALGSKAIQSRLSGIKSGLAKAQTNISQKEILKLRATLPSNIIEQQKIADFLTAVDKRIAQLKEKKRLLTEYKKGVMQQIFSQQIRFTDDNGNPYPDWKEKRLGDVFEVTRGKVLAMPKVSKSNDNGKKYPVYSSQTKHNGLMGFYDDYLFEDCITWTTDGANAGEAKYRSGKFYCTNVCGVLKSDEGYANQCVAEIFNAVSQRYVSYVGNPKLMNNVVATIKVVIPSSVCEQQKIADFLTSIDNKIEQVGAELEQAKTFKKGLLQQMFV